MKKQTGRVAGLVCFGFLLAQPVQAASLPNAAGTVASAAPVQQFTSLSWCRGSNRYVDPVNQLLTQNQTLFSTQVPLAFKLLALGDAYADCARALSKVQTDQGQEKLADMLSALALATEAHFAATRTAASIIDLSPPSKRIQDERFLFATAAHDTLMYANLVKSNSTQTEQLVRVGQIQAAIHQMVPIYGPDQIASIYNGLPQ